MLNLLGLVLLFSPLLLVSRFKNTAVGYASIVLFIVAFHFTSAFTLQVLGIFSQENVLTIHISLLAMVVWQTDWQRIRDIKLREIDWMLAVVAVVTGIYLYQVHYNYTGIISTVLPPFYKEVENFSYPFPYYADEWYAIAFIKDTYETNSLPVRNPLVRAEVPFTNLELAFHTTLSSMMRLTNVEPLYAYVPFTIVINSLLVALLYLCGRVLQANSSASGIGSLLALYITTGANMPGLWYLIPINLGIVAMLASVILLCKDEQRAFFVGSFITLIFYPPLVVFLLPLYVACVMKNTQDKKIILRSMLVTGLVIGIAALIVSTFFLLSGNQANDLLSYVVFSKVNYDTFTQNALPQYALWHIIPWYMLILAGIGLYGLLQNKKYVFVTVPIVVGLIYWAVYSQSVQRFIIEYERVIFGTTMLVTILSIHGVQQLFDALKLHKKQGSILSIISIFIFIVLSFSYTQRTSWQHLTLKDFSINQELKPSAPANDYLDSEEIMAFREYTGEKFISLPWKGTVIGTATGAYPVTIKPGTIAINDRLFFEFWEGSCEQKETMMRTRNIEIAYVPAFECPQFMNEGYSTQGLGYYRLMGVR